MIYYIYTKRKEENNMVTALLQRMSGLTEREVAEYNREQRVQKDTKRFTKQIENTTIPCMMKMGLIEQEVEFKIEEYFRTADDTVHLLQLVNALNVEYDEIKFKLYVDDEYRVLVHIRFI